jgi:hypothetical protein
VVPAVNGFVVHVDREGDMGESKKKVYADVQGVKECLDETFGSKKGESEKEEHGEGKEDYE